MSKVFEKWKVLSLFLALFMVLGVYGTVKANEFAAFKNDWSSVKTIATPTNNQSGLVAALGANKYVCFAWLESDGTNVVIKAQLFNDAGVAQWTSGGITALATSGANLSEPKVVHIGSNQFIITGLDGTNLKAQKLSAGGALQWPTAAATTSGVNVVATTLTDADTYDVVYDGEAIVVAYETAEGDGNSINTIRFSAATSGASAVTTIYTAQAALTAGANTELNDPQLVASSTGSVIVAATTNDKDLSPVPDAPGASVFANIVDGTGNLFAPANTGVQLISYTSNTASISTGKLWLLPDGANGAIAVALVADTGAGLAETGVINGIKYTGTPWETMTADANKIDMLTWADGDDIEDVCFIDDGTTDYIAVAALDSSAGKVVLNKLKIGTVGTFSSKWSSNASMAYAAATADAFKVADGGSGNVVVTSADITADDIEGYYFKEAATGTSATNQWGSDETIMDLTTLAGATDNAVLLSLGDGTAVSAALDDLATDTYKAFRFHDEEMVDLNFVTNLTAVDPIPFQISQDTGGTIKVKDRVQNSGSLASSATTINYYLGSASTYAASTAYRLLLGSRSVPALSAGEQESAAVTTTLTIPPDTTPGATPHIIAFVNQAEYSTESNTTNNESSVPITISSPDLQPFSLTLLTAGNIDPGQEVTVRDTLQNAGNVAAGPFTIRYYLSDSGTLNTTNIEANSVEVGSRELTGLAAGATDQADVTLTIPTSGVTFAGTMFIYAYPDADGAVAEISNTNNVSNTEGIGRVTLTMNLANLTMGTPTVSPALASPGDTMDITDTVTLTNPERIAGSTVKVEYYMAGAGITTVAGLKANGTLLGSRTFTATAGVTSNTATTTVVIPVDARTGDSIWAVVDPDNEIIETNETFVNNTNSTAKAVIATDVSDLTPVAVSPTSLTLNAGESVQVSFAVKNLGGEAVPSNTVAIYLSTDTTFDGTDTLLVTQVMGNIGAETTVTVTGDDMATITIPGGTPDGIYYLILVADYDNAVSEFDETNNAKASAPITVGEVVTYPTLDLRIDPIAGTPGVAFHFTDNVYDANGAAHISANTIQTGTEAVDLYVKCTYPDGQSAWLYFDADGLVRFHDEPAPEWSNVTFDETTDYALIHSAWWFDNSKKAEWNLPIGTYTWEITVVKAGGSIDVPEDIVQTDSATLTLE